LYAKPEWGLCGRDKFNSKLQRQFANISRSQLGKFLQWQEGHQMTIPNRNIPIVRPIAVGAPFRHWQMDLVDFHRLRFQARNHRATWMLIVVDAFFKYGYLRAFKRKSAFSVVYALVLAEKFCFLKRIRFQYKKARMVVENSSVSTFKMVDYAYFTISFFVLACKLFY